MICRKAGAALALALSLAAAPLPLAAQELKVGLSTEPSSLDPQYHNLSPNNQIALHLFEALVAQDPAQNLQPALAVSWKAIDDTTWEFKLREGVTFHDGSPFTAEDVVFTIDRAAKVPNAPSPFTQFTKQIVGIDVVDPMTVRLRTAAPAPLLPVDMTGIRIMSKKAASGPAPEGKTTEQLNRGEGLVGTGPFKFVEWSRGNQLVLERNDAYWGPKPAWKKVIFRPLPNAATRVAGLLSGDVDFIENPPTVDLPKLASNERVTLARALSNRVIYIHLDQFAEPTPGIPDTNGKNPLKDKNVRHALSLALDRTAIVQRIMEGFAVPAADLLPSPMFGTRKDTPVEKVDVARAKKLLADAGYPNGFSITLGTPNGRYINDAKVAETIAALWTRAGVKTQIEASAPPVFFKNRDEHKYSAYLAGWGATTGEMSDPLRALVATPNRERGMGGTNKGRYSNPAVDAKLVEAMRTVDDEKRRTLLQEASKLAMDDYGILPLHFEVSVWAMKKGLTYTGRADQYTLAYLVAPAQ
ncbi:ABC transporter substrate-binding protein [Vineibacter terrae]|uniref:ABC transporter substrate-binding protein n=1 Tax=Vineibacter terrae TaxID=2586908 RepID=A0A5C8PB10_9HYPH|nr:ABC transporter substrate-binding protein [Vineibacter terrae]TXL70991.1 ABC transporter substrate-binding protein [Vineibacter terrae]